MPSTEADVAKPSRPAIPDIVEEHLEELAFLAIRRRTLLFSTTATPRQLARLDARSAAHRDGLRIAGQVAIDLAVGVLDDGDEPWL
nr:hypothetical protein [Planctomycetota bacterium]